MACDTSFLPPPGYTEEALAVPTDSAMHSRSLCRAGSQAVSPRRAPVWPAVQFCAAGVDASRLQRLAGNAAPAVDRLEAEEARAVLRSMAAGLRQLHKY